MYIIGSKADDILRAMIHTKVMKKSQITRLWFTDPETKEKQSRQAIFKTMGSLLKNNFVKENSLSVGSDLVYRVTNKTLKTFTGEVNVLPYKSIPYKGLLLHQLLLAEAYVTFVEQGRSLVERRKLSLDPVWQDAQGDNFKVVSSIPSYMKGVEKLADVFLGGAIKPKVFIEIDNDSKSPKRLEEDLTNWAFALNQKEREDHYRPPVVYLCASEQGASRVESVFNRLSPHVKNQFIGFDAVHVSKTSQIINKYLVQ